LISWHFRSNFCHFFLQSPMNLIVKIQCWMMLNGSPPFFSPQFPGYQNYPDKL
jgi:hypothetical protein